MKKLFLMRPLKNPRSCPLDKLRNADTNKIKHFDSKLIKCSNTTGKVLSKEGMTKSTR